MKPPLRSGHDVQYSEADLGCSRPSSYTASENSHVHLLCRRAVFCAAIDT